jgi:3-oxoacyl-[acyl-carrier protein] reductase
MGLDGSVVVVTGAAQGIGEEIARRLSARGAHLYLADIQLERVQQVAESIRAQGGNAIGGHVDVASPESAEAMIETAVGAYGKVDGLVNNGAIDAQPGLAWEIDEAHWRRFIDTDLSGQWWCTRAVLPHMISRRSGRIVFISSITARVGSNIYSPAYAAAKGGLIGLTVGLSAQLEASGILVNAITPGSTGNTGTPMSEAERSEYLWAYPLGLGGPVPAAEAVCYLLDSSGAWISGAVLNVTGGALRGI